MKRINGRYELQETIGSGGMGVVYKAYDSVVRRSVALKTIRDTPSSMALDLFRRETSILAAISHPNIIEIFDIGEFEEGGSKKPYFVMPLLPGDTMDKITLSVEQVCDVIVQTCRGLQAAHERGLIHRDLKPTNIFILPDRSVKIIDFGVAHMTDSRTSMTVKGGTLPYMSPEQLDRDVAPTSDLFSLGVLFYEAVTRRHPFRFPTEEQTARAIRFFTPPPAWELNQEVGQTVSRIIHKSMAKQPHNRFPSARELSETIQKAQRNEPITIFDPTQIQPRIARAVKAFEEGNLEFAAEIIGKLEAEGHADPALSNLRKQIDEATHDKRIKQLLDSARNCFEAEEYALAQQKIDQVLHMEPSNNGAALLQSSIQNRLSEQKIDEWLHLARQHLDNNAFSHARQAVQNVLQLRPKETTAIQLLGEVDRKEQHFKKTRDEKSRLYQAAMAARKNGEMSSALTKMQRLIALDSEVPDTGDPERGVEHQKFYEQVRADHDAEQNAYNEANRNLRERHFAEAIALCDDFLAKYPGHPRFQALKIDVQDRQRQELSAKIAETDRLVEEQADLDRRVAILKDVCAEYPDEPHFDRALRLARDKRDLVSGIVAKARAYEENGQFNEALERWETLRTIHQQYPGLDIEIKRLRKRRDEQARADAKALWVNQVDALLEAGAHQRALDVLESASGEFPDDEELNALKSIARQALERNVRAAELLMEGRDLCSAGDVEHGLECLRQAHEMDGRNANIRAAYIDALLKEASAQLDKNWDATEELSKQVLNIDPGHPLARSLNIQALDRKRDAFVNKAVAEARRMQADGDLNGALARVELALVSYPQDQRLTQLQTTIRKSVPDNGSRVAGAAEPSTNRPVGWTMLEERLGAPPAATAPEAHTRTAQLQELERLFATSYQGQDPQSMATLKEQAEQYVALYPEDERFKNFHTRVCGAATQLFQAAQPTVPMPPESKPEPAPARSRTNAPNAAGQAISTRWLRAKAWISGLNPRERNRGLAAFGIGIALLAAILLVVKLLPSGSVRVEISSMAGAKIFVDGKDVGGAPAHVQLSTGEHMVRVLRDGYLTVEKRIAVTRSGNNAFDVQLQPLPDQSAGAKPVLPPPPALALSSDLPSASVTLDGAASAMQEGQFTAATLAEGKHTVEIAGGSGSGKVMLETAADGTSRITSAEGKNLVVIAIAASKDGATVVSNLDPPATLWQNGAQRKERIGKTPVTLTALTEADQDFGYGVPERALPFRFSASPTVTISATTEADVSTVVFRTGVPDATVYLDGRPYRNKTNANGEVRIANRPVGEYTVKIEKEDYETFEKKVAFKKGQQSQNAEMKALPTTATIEVTRAPDGAHVYVDGADAGPANVAVTVQRGPHKIEVRHPDYATVQETHEFKAREKFPWQVAMRQVNFPIIVRGTPENARVEYNSNGRQGEIRNSQKLPEGLYTVRITASGFAPKTFNIEVGSGKPNEVAYQLERGSSATQRQQPAADGWTANWKTENGWKIVPNEGMLAPRPVSVISFSVLLQGKKHAGWYIGYSDNDNHVEYELSKDKLQRTVKVNGKKNKEKGDKREPNGIPMELRSLQKDGNTIYDVRVRISGSQIIHELRVNGAWKILDTWTPSTPLPGGRFGFEPETRVEIRSIE